MGVCAGQRQHAVDAERRGPAARVDYEARIRCEPDRNAFVERQAHGALRTLVVRSLALAGRRAVTIAPAPRVYHSATRAVREEATMEQNELAQAVAQAVGQALGEMSVGVAVAVLAATDAVSKQTGIDRVQLFRDMLAALPEVDGAARNVIEVIREAVQSALSAAEDAAR